MTPKIRRMEAGELDGQLAGSRLYQERPTHAPLVRQVYAWEGRNCELHVAQKGSSYPPMRGVAMPTFMPEEG